MSYLALLQEFDLRPKHSLGQVFLIDVDVIERILSILDLKPGDRVIEFGAGPGFITKRLAELTDEVMAVEIDHKFRPLHEKYFSTLSARPEILYEDALKVEFGTYARDLRGRLIVFGNLPYYLTTDLILHAVRQMPNMAHALFMIEQDVLERLKASPGSKRYGVLTIVTGLFGHWRLERTVSRHAFTPKPHVTSALVSIIPSDDELHKMRAADPAFHRFLTDIFKYRRKTLANALKSSYDCDIGSEILERFLSDRGLRRDIRAEQLTPIQFKELYESLEQVICHLNGNSVS